MSKDRTRGNGTGTIYRRESGGNFYIDWYDHAGKRRRLCTLTTDKTAAQRILADKLADVALRREGIIDARLEAVASESARAIEAHLGDFEAMLKARQRGESHVRRTLRMIREVCAAANFDKPDNITADGLNQVIASMQAAGNAPRTIQGRVVAMKQFTKWLADHAKLSHDPLRSVKRPSVKKGRKLLRRMLTPAEWPYLRAATLTSGPYEGMTPLERVALYATAIQTGLRSAELRSLTKGFLFLAGNKPYVRCKCEDTKNSEKARQYIQVGLAEELRQIVANKTAATPVFTMPDKHQMAAMLRSDLAAARKQWLDEMKHDPKARAKREESDFLAVANDQGEKLDFHALRHSTGAWLALQGIHPKTIQTVMRHSTITLTMDTYGHLLPDQHADAIGGMVNMTICENSLAPTGTAGVEGAVQGAVGVRKGAKVSGPVRDMGETAAAASMGRRLDFSTKNRTSHEKEQDWAHLDSNQEPRDYESPALPLSYRPGTVGSDAEPLALI